MELLILSTCSAIFVALFTLLRIPLNRWTVPVASIGGLALVFGLIQVLNFYHPHSPTSRQQLTAVPSAGVNDVSLTQEKHAPGGQNLVAWFHRNSLLRLGGGSAAEVAFDHIPGKVFSGRVERVIMAATIPARQSAYETEAGDDRVAVLIEISDPRFDAYSAKVPRGSYAQAAVYGDEFRQLALVRKTLLRMSAWMNYLTPVT